jgi:hypothetical protein
LNQREAVIEVMEKRGGFATLSQLYQNVDVKNWKTKTPDATIRKIVQDERYFFKIKPGLWALNGYKNKLPDDILILIEEQNENFDKEKKYTHYYYQGIISEIGLLNQFRSYIPPQDKNRPFLNRKLKDVISLQTLPQFTFSTVMKNIKSIDVVWINKRQFPSAVFEVENSTNFKNSLSKFYELLDFSTDMIIVSDSIKYRQFLSIIKLSIFAELQSRVIFCAYDQLDQYYSNPYKFKNFKDFIGTSNSQRI